MADISTCIIEGWTSLLSVSKRCLPTVLNVLINACINHLLFRILQILAEAGAEINARTIDGWTPLHSASQWGQHEVAGYLLHRGADINAQTHGLQTPLHLAASSTHAQSEHILQVRCVSILLMY